jgi:hypothetical protein
LNQMEQDDVEVKSEMKEEKEEVENPKKVN